VARRALERVAPSLHRAGGSVRVRPKFRTRESGVASSVASRFACVGAALGLVLFAGSARAQFGECVLPTNVPEAVFDTILDQAGFDFGSVSGKVCKSITNKGVSTCRTQVKAQERCFRKALEANYAISVKQCHQLGTKQERNDCRSDAKDTLKDGKSEIDDSKDDALDVCKNGFKDELDAACTNGFNT
jgi:hypothetical protein